MDFTRVLGEEYIGFYDTLRRRHFYSLLMKWEHLMATGKSPQDAIESIKDEVKTRKFRLAWTNKELESYFGFFQELANFGSLI